MTTAKRAQWRANTVAVAPCPVRCKDVKKFTDYCVTLRAFWIHYQTLFVGSDLKRELLQQTASIFFRDLNSAFNEHLILQICKLTDPASTRQGKLIYSNLTTQYLLENADFSKDPGDFAKLTKIAKRIAAFRARIVPARNKLIGHLDLEAAQARRSQGRAPVSAWHQFWLDLQDFLTIMHRRYVNKRVPFYLNGVGIMSDNDQLVRAMQESTYFRSALHDLKIGSRLAEIAYGSKFRDV